MGFRRRKIPSKPGRILEAGDPALSAQLLERLADQRCRIGRRAQCLERGSDGIGGLRPAVAERQEGGNRILRGRWRRCLACLRRNRLLLRPCCRRRAPCPSARPRAGRRAAARCRAPARSTPCPARRSPRPAPRAFIAPRTASATLAPTPCTVCSSRNQSRSASVSEAIERIESSRTWVSMARLAGSPTCARCSRVRRRAMHEIADAMHVEDDEILADRIDRAFELADHVPQHNRGSTVARMGDRDSERIGRIGARALAAHPPAISAAAL